MDRNFFLLIQSPRFPASLSARRAWIEMSDELGDRLGDYVALRKESVDRNFLCLKNKKPLTSRSPQGERG